ncbi:LAQU0S21e01266g1_1 [Lachancea quebecensis]|uniref:LAQU0S21e01266g1_1 n=1 Tax=Lachancea quebecensis TaxID=1654605 RepID=A0A0N7MME9_9SACH|nr:LAQU0S21e01266g1_1 [Lachancea quebecensis]
MDDGCLIDFLLEDDNVYMNQDSSCLGSKWLANKDCICDERVIKKPSRKTKSRTKSKRRSPCKELLDEPIDELLNLIIKDTKLPLTIGSKPSQNNKVPQAVVTSKKKSRCKGRSNRKGDDQDLLEVFGGEQLAGEFAFNFLDIQEPVVALKSKKNKKKKKDRRNKARDSSSEKAESHSNKPADQSDIARTQVHGCLSERESNAENDVTVKKSRNKKKKRKGQGDGSSTPKGDSEGKAQKNSQSKAEASTGESKRREKMPKDLSVKSGSPYHRKRSSRKKVKEASYSNDDHPR